MVTLGGFMYSDIFAYDSDNHQLTDTFKRFKYLDGSQHLNWVGISIESLETLAPVAKNIYFKDYYFSMPLKEIEYEVNDSSYSSKVGDIFITPRNTSFNLVNNSAFSTIRCTISHDFLKQHFFDKNIDHIKFTENYRISDSNVRYLMLLIYEQALQKTDFSDPYLNLLFDAFVTHYVNDYSNYNITYDEGMFDLLSLAKIDRYIESNLAENITTMVLAELVGMSNYTFLNEFKKFTDDTPHQYILKKKLDAAKNLLQNSQQSIMTISHALGFTDSSHFSKFFKKNTGLSPSKYKKGL